MEPQRLNYATPRPKKPILRNVVILLVTSLVKLIVWLVAFTITFFIIRAFRQH